ncbi:MAG: fused MFS/spermidine synthase [Gemmatirosa sp.]|nr:fused MFS/spermidine synthase [Gemmatirosa sp.]
MRRIVTGLFVVTIAVNAALLFAVEPMVSRRVLPLFGGAPSVWNTALMAFQALLLAGYLYAHASARWLGGRAQAVAHGAVFALSLLALPPIVRGSAPPSGWPPAAWLLVLLLGAVGAPFVVLAAGAPLLQRWYAARPGRGEPYFLYAASNAGSMLALLGYPVLVEPRLGLAAQARAWAAAYVALGAALAACGVAAFGRGASSEERASERARSARSLFAPPSSLPASRPTARERAAWVALAFVPSSLLLGVTRYVTTDVAPVPLLWVIPLALYLLTFVVAFAERARVPSELLDLLFAASLPVLALLTALGVNRPLWAIAGVHLIAVALASLVCHQALADRRPGAGRLTEYYLWISFGGLAGGVFNAIVAPAVFDTLAEYPLAMALAAGAWALGTAAPEPPRPIAPSHLFARLAAPSDAPTRLERVLWYAVAPMVAGGLLCGAVVVRAYLPAAVRTSGSAALGVGAALLCYALRPRRLAYAVGVAALLVGGWWGQRVRGGDVLLHARSFFGAYSVRRSGPFHHLQNGTTLHGAQDERPGRRTTPLTYYHHAGPLAALFAEVPALADASRPRRVAVVGLGTGTIACYGRAGERWTFYEIDPLIARIARDARYFTYLRDCPPAIAVVIGDARLRLADAPPAGYDLIVLDAFSSDAIPTHLLTREALALYLTKLAPDGVIAVHVSNRYLDLVPVVAELARDARIAGSYGNDMSDESRRQAMLSSSSWVALARHAATLGPLTRQKGWAPLPPTGAVRLWTDDFTDVIDVVKWR